MGVLPGTAASWPAARSAAPGAASSRAEALSRSRRLKVMTALPVVRQWKIHCGGEHGYARLPFVSARQRSLTLRMSGPTELVLERADGTQHSIHPLWLRERCKDPASIDPQTQQRLQDPSDF